MCGKKNCTGCTECSEKIYTSDVEFNGEFNNIVIPDGSDLNDVLLLIETYIDTQISQLDELSFTIGTNCLGLTPGTYSYAQMFSAINTAVCALQEDINTLNDTVATIETQVSNFQLLYADFPENSSTGTTFQNLDNDNYDIPAWYDVPVGTSYEVEVDLVSAGAADDPLTYGGVGFFLTESNALFPASAPDTPAIPLVCDDEQALNVKMTLTKKSNTSAFASVVAHKAPNSSSPTATLVYTMSDFVTIATAPATPDRIEISVLPVTGQTITLNRTVIKKLIPQS